MATSNAQREAIDYDPKTAKSVEEALDYTLDICRERGTAGEALERSRKIKLNDGRRRLYLYFAEKASTAAGGGS